MNAGDRCKRLHQYCILENQCVLYIHNGGEDQTKKVGEFNEAKIVVLNNQIEHWLNGKKILQYEYGSNELKNLIAKSKFARMPLFAKENTGHIGLQHHGEEVWYRNIKIRKL